MSIESDVFTLLSGYSGLTSVVPAARITPLIRKAGSALPAVAYMKISDTRVRHFGGDATFSEARIQVNAYAATFSSMKSVQLQIRLAMQSSESTFDLTEVAEGPDVYDDLAEEYFTSTDFTVWHRNA